MKAVTNRAGKCTCEFMVELHFKKEHAEKEKTDDSSREWEKILSEANKFLRQDEQKSRWTAKECIVVLKHLRQSKDEKIPKLKNDASLLHDE